MRGDLCHALDHIDTLTLLVHVVARWGRVGQRRGGNVPPSAIHQKHSVCTFVNPYRHAITGFKDPSRRSFVIDRRWTVGGDVFASEVETFWLGIPCDLCHWPVNLFVLFFATQWRYTGMGATRLRTITESLCASHHKGRQCCQRISAKCRLSLLLLQDERRRRLAPGISRRVPVMR